jgi:hypothetical protein
MYTQHRMIGTRPDSSEGCAVAHFEDIIDLASTRK